MTTLFKVICSERHSTLAFSIAFGTSLFIQCLLFNILAFQSLIVTLKILNPVVWAYYLSKISICCFLSFLVPLFKKKGWTIICSFIVGVWVLAELIYFRANGIVLDAFSFTMIGNMRGFWNGVIVFFRPNDLLLLLPTLLLVGCFFLLKPRSVSIKSAIVLLLLSVGFHIAGTIFMNRVHEMSLFERKEKTRNEYNPFSEEGVRFWGWTINDYAKMASVIHCFVLDIWHLVKMPLDNSNSTPLSTEEEYIAQLLFNSNNTCKSVPKGNLYIILFESFENWAISPATTPVIVNFIQSHDNILWAQKITCQTKEGKSADGQMIINTGILPVLNGATCFRFPGNCFPSLSELYEKSALILPGDVSIWNQKRMSDAYHITDNFENHDGNDAITFSKLTDIYYEYPYVLAISMASHTPFVSCPPDMKMDWNSEMPEIMRRYLDCVHYTDYCLSGFLDKVDTDETLRNSTIIITGDHTFFDNEIRHKFNEYCVSQGEPFTVNEAYCPLIIYSPSIQEKTIIKDAKYQMDIYPTTLFAIGSDSTYYWKGFGINLLDKNAKRVITGEQASILSNKMTLLNYWKVSAR